MSLDFLDYLSIGASFFAVCAGIWIIWVGFKVMPTLGLPIAIGNFALGGINFFMAGFNIWIVKESHK